MGKKYEVHVSNYMYETWYVEAEDRDDAERIARGLYGEILRNRPEHLLRMVHTEPTFGVVDPDWKPPKRKDPRFPKRKLERNEVLVTCYGEHRIHDRREALEFYREGAMACEGPERDRYTNIVFSMEMYPKYNWYDDEGNARMWKGSKAKAGKGRN